MEHSEVIRTGLGKARSGAEWLNEIGSLQFAVGGIQDLTILAGGSVDVVHRKVCKARRGKR